jgi:2-dehydro-3-deoxygluconokinase
MTKPVVDTTAAGDSFAAAYIAARLGGSDPVEAAQAGHRLASLVICYPGAIIPGYAMPPKRRHRPAPSRQATK